MAAPMPRRAPFGAGKARPDGRPGLCLGHDIRGATVGDPDLGAERSAEFLRPVRRILNRPESAKYQPIRLSPHRGDQE